MTHGFGEAVERLHAVIEARRGGDPAASYTAQLFERGTAKIAQKLGEEAVEAAIAAAMKDRGALVAESADLLYHLLVAWADAEIAPAELASELALRSRRHRRRAAPTETANGFGSAVERLYAEIESGRRSASAASKAAQLRGTAKIAQKLGEEAVEAAIAAVMKDRRALAAASDGLLYHLLAAWADAEIAPAEVAAELARRSGVSGLEEKAARGDDG